MDGNKMLDELKNTIGELEESLEFLNKHGGNDELKNNLRLKISQMKGVYGREKAYREEHDKLTKEYLLYSELYAETERIEKIINDPMVSAEEKKNLKEAHERKIRSNGITEGITNSSALREKLERIAFDINKLNGLVDEQVLNRDKAKILDLSDAEKNKEEHEKEKEKLEKKLAQREEKKNSLEGKLTDLENKRRELQELRSKLSGGRLNKSEIKKIQERINELIKSIKDLGPEIEELLKALGMGKALNIDFSNPDAISFESINALKSKVENCNKDLIDKLDKINQKITKEEQRIKERNSILEKYEITDGDISKLNGKVDEIKGRYNPLHMGRVARQREVLTPAPAASRTPSPAPAAPNPAPAPRTPSPAPAAPNPVSGTPNPTPAAPNPAPGTPNPALATRTPSPATGTPNPAPGTPAPAPRAPSPAPVAQNPAPVYSRNDMSRAGSNLPLVPGQTSRVLYEEPVSFNLKEQIYQPGKQKIENGMLYRFEKEGNTVRYIAEDVVETYLKDPKKALMKAVEDTRKRMIKEMGKKEFKKMCKEMKAQNGGKNTELTKLISNNGIFNVLSFDYRYDKINRFAKKIGKEVGPLGQAQMAMALNSAVLPEDIQSTISRTFNPYTYPSDLNVVVQERKVFKFLPPKIELVKQPTLMQNETIYGRTDSSINNQPLEDGMLRPFEIPYTPPKNKSVHIPKENTQRKRQESR